MEFEKSPVVSQLHDLIEKTENCSIEASVKYGFVAITGKQSFDYCL